MTRKILLTSVLLTSIFAEQPYSIVNSAIEAHPDVNRQIKYYNGVLQDLEIAKSDNLPTLDYIGELGRERSSSDNTNTTNLNYYKNNLTLRQNLFRGYKTQSEIKQNEARIASAAYTVLDKANTVALDTISAYIEVLKEHYLTKLFKENVQNHEDILAKIKERNDAGVGKKSEVLQTESRLKLAYSNLLVQQNNFIDTLTQYHFMVGRDFDQNQYIEPTINYKLPDNIDKTAYLALINNPSIKALKSNILAKKAEYKKAKSDFYPILDAVASQDWNNNADGIEGDDRSTSIALVARWNLYRGGADEANRLKSLESINEERKNLRRIQRDIIKQAKLAYMAYKAYTYQMEYLKEHVNKSKLTLEAYLEEYGLGRRDLLAILDAQKEYNSAQQTLITAKYDLLKSKFRVANTTNKLIYIIKSNIPSKLILTSIEEDLNNDKNFAKNVLCDNPINRKNLDQYDCKHTNIDFGYKPKIEKEIVEENYIKELPNITEDNVAKPTYIKLSKVYFATNKYNITPQSEKILRENIKKLNEKKNYKLQILGYTDSIGNSKLNKILSQNRAIATKLKLIELGAKLKQVEIIPMGATNPIASNDTKQDRALNRRVELKIVEL